MRTFLVTGGAGFIGSHFVNFLCENYPADEIVVLDALTYASDLQRLSPKLKTSPKFRFIEGSTLDRSLVSSLMAKASHVIHFATESHVTRSLVDSTETVSSSVLGTQTLLETLKVCPNIERFIFLSSSEVYGSSVIAMNETFPMHPTTPYAAGKAGADLLCQSFVKTYRLPITIIRPFNNFGPGQHPEKLVARFVTASLLLMPLEIHGEGLAARDFLHVADSCSALDAVLNAPDSLVEGEIFNLGSGRSFRVIDLANMIREKMSTTSLPLHRIDERPGQIEFQKCDYAKIRSRLGWEPSFKFEQGLETTIEWYRANQADWSRHLDLSKVRVMGSTHSTGH